MTIALQSVLRAAFGYCFLIFIVRIAGRRPGKQLTPFEFVLIFYLGGLTLTGIVGTEASLTNAAVQIITLACVHYGIVWLRTRSPKIARVLDGTPLLLLEGGKWRARTMAHMRIQDDDVMAMARDRGIRTLDEIGSATLERNGEISLIKSDD